MAQLIKLHKKRRFNETDFMDYYYCVLPIAKAYSLLGTTFITFNIDGNIQIFILKNNFKELTKKNIPKKIYFRKIIETFSLPTDILGCKTVYVYIYIYLYICIIYIYGFYILFLYSC